MKYAWVTHGGIPKLRLFHLLEATTSMKMAPGHFPVPLVGRVPEQRLLSPELGFWMAAELGRVSGKKILRVSYILGQGVFMGEEAT